MRSCWSSGRIGSPRSRFERWQDRAARKHTKKSLRAALDLFGERGIDATSMDAIAQASGVSKATIYNHWADKEALLMEVMLMVHGLDREPEDEDSGDLLPRPHRRAHAPPAGRVR